MTGTKRPRDTNQLAKMIADIATGEVEDVAPPTGKDPAAVALGKRGGLKGGKADNDIHPFIRGLLDKLPEPESGWSIKDRYKWLNTATNIFELMYSAEDNYEIEIRLKKIEPEAGRDNEL